MDDEKQATIIEKCNQATDVKILGIKNELRQITQLIETIKFGSKRIEDTFRKEIELIKGKQTKIDQMFSNDMQKTLNKLMPMMKNQMVTSAHNQGINTPAFAPLQKLLQQFTTQMTQGRGQTIPSPTQPFGGNMGMGNMQIPNIFSMLQQFIQPSQRLPFGGNQRFPFVQEFMGGMPFGGHKTFPGFSNFPRMGEMPFGKHQSFPKMPGMPYEKPETEEIPHAYRKYKDYDEAPKPPSSQVATPIPPGRPSIGGYQETGKSTTTTPQGVPKKPETTSHIAGKSYGWWTPERQQHAIDRLRKEGGLSEMGARGLVARWAHVEATQGPSEVNRYSGALGIGQWMGSRKKGITNDFDIQITKTINELNSSEKRAGNALRSAKTAEEAARGASMYERAEGYNPSTGRDAFTDKTIKNIPFIGSSTANEKILKTPSLA